jgi:hypothetical protein
MFSYSLLVNMLEFSKKFVAHGEAEHGAKLGHLDA